MKDFDAQEARANLPVMLQRHLPKRPHDQILSNIFSIVKMAPHSKGLISRQKAPNARLYDK